MHVFRFQQLAINCTFAKREKCKQHYRILREVDINIIITKNDNIDGAGNLPKLYLLNILAKLYMVLTNFNIPSIILKRGSKDTES